MTDPTPVRGNYPTNSHKAKVEPAKDAAKPAEDTRPRPGQVTQNKVVQRKKPLGTRMVETFIGEEPQNVASYLATDVILPAVKNTVVDLVTQGIERLIFGDSKGRFKTSGAARTNYTNYSKPGNIPQPRSLTARERANHEFDQIFLETRAEGEAVLDAMQDYIDNYDVVSVSDLISMVGQTPNWVDNKWGWNNLQGAGMTNSRQGYRLDLPPAIPLD